MEVSKLKIIFLDIETTGISPESHGITQISGFVQIENEIKESFDFHLRPYPQDVIDDEALKITGINPKQFLPVDDPNFLSIEGQDFIDPQEGYARLKEIFARHVNPYDKLDKFHFAGYNAHSFDMPFVRKFFEKNNDRFFGSWFWYHCLDVMLIAAQILQPVRGQLPNFKLVTVAKYLGIEVDESRLHDSLYDVELTRKLWVCVNEIISAGIKANPLKF